MSDQLSPMLSNVYAIPAGFDFTEVFVRGLLERLKDQPAEALARAEIFVPNRRAARAIEDAISRIQGRASFLPKLIPISDLASDPLRFPHLPRQVPRMRRRLHLIRLVTKYLETGHDRPPVSAATALADSLALLLDELQEEGISPENLDGLAHAAEISSESAAHWQETLAFADLIRRAWPEILAEAEPDCVDPALLLGMAIEDLAKSWISHPPQNLVAIAGSTGSRTPTAKLMALVATLPNGAVILPGFDPAVERDIWEQAGAEHPFGPFRNALARMAVAPSNVQHWVATTGSNERTRLLTQALRPAPVTDAWADLAPTLGREVIAATGGLSLIEADHQRAEAGALALAIRQAIEDPRKRVALITPDATLARRVTSELDRFGIEPDDSLGRPLAQTPAAVFLRLIAAAANGPFDPVVAMGLLKHPFCRNGMSRGTHLRHTRRYEIAVLRNGVPHTPKTEDFPPWEGGSEAEAAWLASACKSLVDLRAALGSGDLAEIISAYFFSLNALASDESGDTGALWQGEDGQQLVALLTELSDAAHILGPDTAQTYASLLDSLIAGETVRTNPERPHPRVMIWGTLEARIQSADLVILAGLNEGTWPSAPAPDPWLSRPMRAALGLNPPERSVGLAAHDFLQAASHRDVILSRSRKLDGTPQVASRWLKRLENLLQGMRDRDGRYPGEDALDAMRGRGQYYLDLLDHIHRPAASTPPEQRPYPKPPVECRPRRLSVTQIETLIRDPYAIYARKVLGLEPLEPIGRTPSYLERGSLMHQILEDFIETTKGHAFPPHQTARDLLLQIADRVLDRHVPWPDIQRIWRGRILRFADWFVAGEAERRRLADPVALEVIGRLTLTPAGQDFEITARADRIDRTASGQAVIYDYKTGGPPTPKQTKYFQHQLHLEAAMLMSGGFEAVSKCEVLTGAYLGLTGSGDGGAQTQLAELSAEAPARLEHVEKLIANYFRPGEGYLSLRGSEKQRDEGDYDHLARRGEWEGKETP